MKLYLLLGLLLIGIAGYTAVELIERRKKVAAGVQLKGEKFELVKGENIEKRSIEAAD